MKKAKSKSWKKGFALITVLGFAAVLAVFTAAIGAQAAFNLQMVQRQGETDQAYYGAFSAIQLCMDNLRTPPPYDYEPENPSSVGSWLEFSRQTKIKLGTSVEAAARVYHNIEGFPGAVGPIYGTSDPDKELPPDGTVVPRNHFYIMSVAEVNPEAGSGVRFEAATMGATIAPVFPTMPHAIFGYEEINLNGNIYHFDSRQDLPYQPLTNPQSNPEASIATNSEEADKLTIFGGGGWGPPELDANVYLGTSYSGDFSDFFDHLSNNGFPGPNPSPGAVPPLYGTTLINFEVPSGTGSWPISGRIGTLVDNRLPPEVAVPEIVTELSAGSHTISSTQTLQGGKNYFVPGDLTITAAGNINVSGDEDAVLFVGGNIQIQGPGARINNNQAPRRLKIFALGEDAQFEMSQREGFFLIAGNDLTVTLTGNDENPNDTVIWGAVLGHRVNLHDGATIHYDVSLRDPNLLADVYGYQIVGFAASAGAVVSPGNLAPPQPPPAAPPGGDPPPPGGGGCGCGCGGGSEYFMMK